MLRVYNTLTRRKEDFRPLRGKTVRMFVCGPTVYDYSHIGHARTYITFDVIARYLRSLGYNLLYLQNITDIDDKIIDRANEQGQDFKTFARKFEQAYYEDMDRLGIASVDKYARASDYIETIVAQIQKLEERGFAYITSSGVYFHIPKFQGYGKLSHQKLNKIKQAVRIEADEEKKYPADFALWKFAKPGEPSWPSPWGEGRPGWHIEDTAITFKELGPQYDLHGGALDLIFPHHESEIAQNEAAYDVEPFVKYWMHAGFLNVRGEKMAKSEDNFITIRELLEKSTPEIFRLLVLSAHYRSPIDYDEKLLKQASASSGRIVQFRERLTALKGVRGAKSFTKRIKKAREDFLTAMDDDFDTPGALAAIFELIRDLNPRIEDNALTAHDRKEALSFLEETNAIFGILPEAKVADVPGDIGELVEKREALRKEKKFDEADAVRKQLLDKGWELEDTAHGSRLRRVHGNVKTQNPNDK